MRHSCKQYVNPQAVGTECTQPRPRQTVYMHLTSDSSVLFVGDTHANTAFLENAVLPTAAALEVDAIIQVGDFGFDSSSSDFIDLAASAKKRFGLDVWFLDGNHENHDFLHAELAQLSGREFPREPVNIAGGLWYLPRGARFVAAGLTAVAVGGAVSIDRAARTPGIDWFPSERLNNADLEAIAALGPCDLFVSHDAPSGWTIPGLLSELDLPEFWKPELEACNEHRFRVREAFDAIQPRILVHGHYHVPYRMELTEDWGTVSAFGLDCDTGRIWGALMTNQDGAVSVRAVG